MSKRHTLWNIIPKTRLITMGVVALLLIAGLVAAALNQPQATTITTAPTPRPNICGHYLTLHAFAEDGVSPVPDLEVKVQGRAKNTDQNGIAKIFITPGSGTVTVHDTTDNSTTSRNITVATSDIDMDWNRLNPINGPTVQIINPAENATVNPDFQLTARADAHSGQFLTDVEYFIDGTSIKKESGDPSLANGTFSYSVHGLASGAHSARILATQDDGLRGEDTVRFTVGTIVTPPPTSTYTVSGDVKNNDGTLPITIPQIIELENRSTHEVKTTTPSTTDATWSFSGIPNGSYIVRAKAYNTLLGSSTVDVNNADVPDVHIIVSTSAQIAPQNVLARIIGLGVAQAAGKLSPPRAGPPKPPVCIPGSLTVKANNGADSNRAISVDFYLDKKPANLTDCKNATKPSAPKGKTTKIVTNLEPGFYCVWAAETATINNVDLALDTSVSPSPATPIEVRSSQNPSVEFHYVKKNKTGSITVKATNANDANRPIAVAFSLASKPDNQTDCKTVTKPGSAGQTTKKVTDLAPGFYCVWAAESVTISNIPLILDSNTTPSPTTPIEVQADQDASIEFHYIKKPNTTISVTIPDVKSGPINIYTPVTKGGAGGLGNSAVAQFLPVLPIAGQVIGAFSFANSVFKIGPRTSYSVYTRLETKDFDVSLDSTSLGKGTNNIVKAPATPGDHELKIEGKDKFEPICIVKKGFSGFRNYTDYRPNRTKGATELIDLHLVTHFKKNVHLDEGKDNPFTIGLANTDKTKKQEVLIIPQGGAESPTTLEGNLDQKAIANLPTIDWDKIKPSIADSEKIQYCLDHARDANLPFEK